MIRIKNRLCPRAGRVEMLESRQLLSAGQLDASFGAGGTTLLDLPGATPTDLVVLPNAKILITGRITSGTSNTLFFARFTADGYPDRTFGGRGGDPSGVVRTNVQVSGSLKTEPLSNGQLLTVASRQLTRFNANGSLDRTFMRSQFKQVGYMFNATCIGLEPDGQILVGGRYRKGEEFGGVFAAARCNANGSLDTSFAEDGLFTYADPIAGTPLAIRQLDNSMMLSGYLDRDYPNDMTEYRDQDMLCIKIDDDGELVSGYGVNGVAKRAGSYFAGARVNTFISPDGSATYITYSDMDRISRFTANGQLDSFSFTDHIGDKSPHSVLVQSDGAVVYAGTEFLSGPEGMTSAFITRVTSGGIFDSSFGNNGHTTLSAGTGDNTFSEAEFAQDGSILVTGLSSGRIILARYWRDDAPAAQALAPDRTTRTGSQSDAYSFKVIVRDDLAVNRSTLTAGAFRVVGPDGKKYTLKLLSIDSSAGPAKYVLHLKLPAPNGTWDPSNNGRYKIQLLTKRIFDKTGHFSSGRTIGSFTTNTLAKLPAPSGYESFMAISWTSK